MERGVRLLVSMGSVAILVSSCAGGAEEQPSTPSPEAAEQTDRDVEPEELLAEMSLEEKVGQLFVPYTYGESATTENAADVSANQAAYGVDNAAELIETYNVGGIIYFDWSGNFASGSPEQVASLSNGLQDAALSQPNGIPLIISVDQEGGPVTRIGEPVTQFPDAATLGATEDTALAEEAAAVGARELRAMGINQNYAPVGDVQITDDNPAIDQRSFGDDPGLVAEMTAAQVRGIQGENVAASVKHFPGHGNTDVDSHFGVPVVDHDRSQWEELDAPPFTAAIDEEVDSVLVGHLVYPELDSTETPATLSEPIISGMLRDEMGFDGVVVTDALDMEGVRESYSDDEVAVLAIQAGVDQLLQPPSGEFVTQYEAVLDAVAEGELTEERVDESVLRILTLKKELGLFEDPFADEAAVSDVVGIPEHQDVADRAAGTGNPG
ncbi:beta-hexosaminidase [Spiractinospora alimapuensis]|uniref:glycoside hydrolase family 3 protein n=1 Tax=Spiractinospora alimapuensis TaxID=2820884 RepID=UPI001F2826E5|nr:glycoside hydrolase family 3 protein [Spiractinospora alimapuensis]QVQ50726.1 beta-hexosaminidase [Spiractinospora alimapuensis]